jgi:hypothetical protein
MPQSGPMSASAGLGHNVSYPIFANEKPRRLARQTKKITPAIINADATKNILLGC